MIAFALMASVFGASAKGSPTAFGLTIGLVGGLIILAILAAFYWIGIAVAGMRDKSNPSKHSNSSKHSVARESPIYSTEVPT